MTRQPHLPETPSQTAGPYVHIGTAPTVAGLPDFTVGAPRNRLAPDEDGDRITVSGRVLDGDDAPVCDAMIELYQVDAKGKALWGRTATDLKSGTFQFDTVRPASLPGHSGQLQAPHLSLLVFARGINLHLHTRIYFPENGQANAADPVFGRAVPPHRRHCLLAEATAHGSYVFDIRLQGADETVFFDM